ncbi:MAG: type I glutamate--ammonia ligase [Bacteroidetes bacterium]|nr:type I glutamate--ammonia ligase [Bacteroidota bacterium]
MTTNIKTATDLQEKIFKQIKENSIEFIRLQFTDIFGFAKNITIDAEKFDKAIEGKQMFDGSSVDGFGRITESDMYLQPDLSTFESISWRPDLLGVAHVFCDIYKPDGIPFSGCSRNILRTALAEASDLGFDLNVGPEGEFFLFEIDEKGMPIFNIHDNAGYFDLSPEDRGEDARLEIMLTMKKLGFSVEASHHEVAPGQHEINFKYANALWVADKWMTFKQIVKNIAQKHELHASFLPKPFSGENANAMHCNQSLVYKDSNSFYDPDDSIQLSKTARYYIGGLLNHAKGMAAITNPIINSYKRLVPGYEAPTNIAWSLSNRSALIRIPNSRKENTRIELRNPDPAANPYLVFAIMLKAGIEGIKNKITPPAYINKNLNILNSKERHLHDIQQLPKSLEEALDEMEKDPLIRETLGEHSYNIYLQAKRQEWKEYREEVHEWEIKRYFKHF